jgi:dTDP-4-dehydrorhamnose 3,5-epimerase-like enzyme
MIIKGNIFTDNRGVVSVVNDFDFSGIVRFYSIKPRDIETIRAWQGHKFETKYFFAVIGSFAINWIKIDNWENPSNDLAIYSAILSDINSEILKIDPGHITGIKALDENSTLMVFSNKNLSDSKNDDYRYPLELFNFKN